MKKVSASTIARTFALFFALLNQVLTMLGVNPLPWSEEEAYEGITLLLTVGASLLAWWKNNSFTKEAVTADNYLRELRGNGHEADI